MNAGTPTLKPGTHYAIGVDYGTSSARALVVDCADGREVGSAVYAYRHGTDGVVTDHADPNLARQHPADYTDGFVITVKQALEQTAKAVPGFSASQVVGIGIDTTGSTPIPVDRAGTPLALLPQFANNKHALAWLWKDHTAHAEAVEITQLATKRSEPYLAKCGGVYSSEWFWSKVLRCKRVAPDVFAAAYSWVELCDFVPAWVCGNTDPHTLVRGVCSAGHKAMYATQWGGLPSESFLAALDPALAPLRSRLYDKALPSSEPAGVLCEAVASQVGLRAGVPVAVGAFDAHHGAVGVGVEPGALVKIMGTSTCDIAVWHSDKSIADVPGLCGMVPGSVLPGMIGLEAGQSAVGDLFQWAAANVGPGGSDAHMRLTADAVKLKPGASGLLALDWNNGNRTVLVNPRLTGLLVGQTLHTTAAEVYRAMIEATAFGSRVIVERFEQYGISIDRVIACGGIAEKSPLVMQTYADILGRPIRISRSSQTCALGAAIFGSVVGKAHANCSDAQQAMTAVREQAYEPNPAAVAVYNQLFAFYRRLHDAFGIAGSSDVLADVMPALIDLRQQARAGASA